MRIKFTVLYDGGALVRKSNKFDLLSQDDDPHSFDEALDYVRENLVELYEDEGYEIEENEDDEEDVGSLYLGSWVVYADEELDHNQAQVLAARLVAEANVVLEELE